jgi:energy-converting hydrogenase B subunit D
MKNRGKDEPHLQGGVHLLCSMTTILLLLLLVMGILALETKELLKAVIFLAVFSLISALLFFYLHAPDVALTEAAVGAGISTVIFIWVIQKTDRKDAQ